MINIRRTVAATAVAASALVGAAAVIAPAADAAPAAPQSWVSVLSCTSAPGTITYSPGLLMNKSRTTAATVASTLSGCSDALGGHDESGTGQLSVQLSGTSSYGHVSERGTFVINWPQFYNPSTGTATLSGPGSDGMYTITGTTTGGAFQGSPVSLKVFPTRTNAGATGRVGHALTKQWFTNTTPLTVSRNFG
jgi:hypothetical protein